MMQPFILQLQTFLCSLVVYGFASVIAIGIGLLSLRVDGVKLSFRFLSLVVGANTSVLLLTHALFNRFESCLSYHYEVWLILIIFVPLASVNGWLYGKAFPAEAMPFESVLNIEE